MMDSPLFHLKAARVCCMLLALLLLLANAVDAAAAAAVVASNGGTEVKENDIEQHFLKNETSPPYTFINYHRTINLGGPVQRRFQPTNNVILENGETVQDKDFVSGLHELIDIVALAESNGKRLRAYGSKWSLSEVAYTPDYLVETWGLTYLKVGIDNDSHVTTDYQHIKNRLAFVQTGVFVQSLNKKLLQAGLALPTSGASDGQRLVGAVSTGTHGSALEVGGMESFVKGIHLVIPGEHVFIQRQSDPVVTEEYATESLSGARLIQDDDIFNAVLVSFGSMGLIHGLVIEAVPLYRLKKQSAQFDYPDIKAILTSLDVASLGVQGVDEYPFHFECSINPYNLERGGNGAFVRFIQKIPLSQEEIDEIIHSLPTRVGESNGEPDIIESIGSAFTKDVPSKVKSVLYSAVAQHVLTSIFPVEEPQILLPSEQFSSNEDATNEFTSVPVPSASVEVAVPLESLQDAIDVILGVFKKQPIPTVLAIRYVRSSNASLSFTKFGPVTATIELPSPHGEKEFSDTGQIYQEMFDALAASRATIPHSYHWGQQFPLNEQWVAATFGPALEEWLEVRRTLLDSVGRNMFANDMLESIGLHEP